MTELVTQSASKSLNAMTSEQLDLIKRTVAKGATNDELALFLHQCQRTGLDPLSKQIYFVKYGGQATFQTGIDGYYTIASRTGRWAGNETKFRYDETGKALEATAVVKKVLDNGVIAEFSASCLMVEYNKNQGLWRSLPTRMLEKCAESAALRKAFPNELGGTYTREEMQHQKLDEDYDPTNKAHRQELIKIAFDLGIREQMEVKELSDAMITVPLSELKTQIEKYLKDNGVKVETTTVQ